MAEDTGPQPPTGATPDSWFPLTGETPDSQRAAPKPPPSLRLQVTAVAEWNLTDFQNGVPALGQLALCNETRPTKVC
ncbi:MAG: hypothetical protein H7274_15665 [Rhodoferax sp.]|nr:hypothetical protein [Rhodoferax sp.]